MTRTNERRLLEPGLAPGLALGLALLAGCAAPADGDGATAADVASAEPSEPTGNALPIDRHPRGWLAWRGPNQNGTSPETDLFDTLAIDGENHLWSYPLSGRGAPVVNGDRLYGLGYEGSGPEIEEVLFCLDAATGELRWERRWSDFLSDVIYERYAIGSPTIDPATGNVFSMTAAGLVHAFTPDGDLLWERSMMEELGRLTFPNGRTGSPVVVGNLVIVHFIFAAWGPMGPASDRFFAFDKQSGQVVWVSSPGVRPYDSSFSTAIVEERNGRWLGYASLGGGSVACLDVLTGDPLWRFPFAVGGINSSALIHGDKLIVIHGKENHDASALGRMVALDLNAAPGDDGVLPPSAELWRNDLVAFTSSPVLVGDRVYATTQTGELHCVDVETGRSLWHEKLGPDQLHASPLWADGKLYVPITNGSFWVVRPSDEGCEVLASVQLEGSCLGAPTVADGRVYVHTTDRLYCFGEVRAGTAPEWSAFDLGPAGEPARLQVLPADGSYRVGRRIGVHARRLDAGGRVVDEVSGDRLELEPPPILGATGDGALEALRPGVGVVRARAGDLEGTARVRVVPALPLEQDFEGYELDQGDGTWAWPPGHWLGGRMKWKVVDQDGSRVIARRMENPIFQRTMTLITDPDDADYTMQVDVKSDGSRRTLGDVGVVHQRYLIRLRGNYQELEVSSNEEHLKVGVPFKWKLGTWYRLKTKVDVRADGTAVVRAKAWPRDEPEPEAWTTEVEDPHGHTHGAAGVYGFTPQNRFAVYLDNLTVTPDE